MPAKKPKPTVNHEARARVASLEQAAKTRDATVDKLIRSQREREGAIQTGVIVGVITTGFALLAAQFPTYELWHEVEAFFGTLFAAFGGAIWAGIQHKRKRKDK